MGFAEQVRKIEAEYQRLKRQVEAGTLTQEEAKAQHKKTLMIQDEDGRWWTIGWETGQWYCHDREKWVQREPLKPDVSMPPVPVAKPMLVDWMMVLGGAIGFAVGNVISTPLWQALGEDETATIVAVLFWGVIGGAALGLASRDAKKVLVLSLLGALGFSGGYISWLALGRPWGLWGAVAGLLLGVALKNVIKAIAVSLVGLIAFPLTQIVCAGLYDAGAVTLADGLRGAIIGAAFGFALSYLEKRGSSSKQGR